MPYFRNNVERTPAYVPGFQPQAPDIVKLNTNENPYPPSPQALKALQALSPEHLRRYPSPQGDAFRQAAAQLHGLIPDWIICCNGGDDLLSIAIRAICDEQRALAYPWPTYSLYPVLARMHDCPVIEVPFNADFSLPAELARVNAPLTIVCNPNAPSATMIPATELGQLARDLDGILLIDEAYVDYADADCLGLVKEHDNVLILRSMSKGYSLAGARFGYGVAQPALIEGLLKVKDSYNVTAMSIAVATAALQDQNYLRAMIAQIKQHRADLTGGLRDLGWTVGDSQTNFVLAQVTGADATEIHAALAQRHIYVRYFNMDGLRDKLRISVGTPQQNQRLLSALQDILKDSNHEPQNRPTQTQNQ